MNRITDTLSLLAWCAAIYAAILLISWSQGPRAANFDAAPAVWRTR